MGIFILGLLLIYSYNIYVVNNSSIPESILKNKYNSIYYHFFRENIASGTYLISYILSVNNLDNLYMKIISSGVKYDGLIDIVLSKIVDNPN